MTTEQKQVKEWMTAFGQETPDKPTLPSKETRLLRAKVILEEALETIDALGFDLKLSNCSTNTTSEYIRLSKIEFEPLFTNNASLHDIADGCEDLKVVTEGTLVACGLLHQQNIKEASLFNQHTDPLFDEVMRSNWTKLWTTEEIEKLPVDEPVYYREFWATTGEKRFIVFDTNGKVIKSPSYTPPNLQPIINELSKK